MAILAEEIGLKELFSFFDLEEAYELIEKLDCGQLKIGDDLSDVQCQTLTVALAAKGWGWTSPNPPVGCVIASKDNKLLGWGYHKKAGEPHAEIEALMKAFGVESLSRDTEGEWILPSDLSSLKGAKVFVSLEPCSFKGRTPSCAKTLSRLPISEVWSLTVDPHPKVSGQGFEILAQANKCVRRIDLLRSAESKHETSQISLQKESMNQMIHKLNEFILSGFQNKVRNQRPLLIGKIATSLDGFYAMKDGESQWITGLQTRAFARLLRGACEAVLTTSRTILADDPLMDARETMFSKKSRELWIWDPRGALANELEQRTNRGLALPKVFSVGQFEKIRLFLDSSLFEKFLSTPLAAPLTLCATQDLDLELSLFSGNSVWVESGGSFLTELLQKKKLDELFLFMGPKLIGGQKGLHWSQNLLSSNLASALQAMPQRAQLVGQDLAMWIKLQL